MKPFASIVATICFAIHNNYMSVHLPLERHCIRNADRVHHLAFHSQEIVQQKNWSCFADQPPPKTCLTSPESPNQTNCIHVEQGAKTIQFRTHDTRSTHEMFHSWIVCARGVHARFSLMHHHRSQAPLRYLCTLRIDGPSGLCSETRQAKLWSWSVNHWRYVCRCMRANGMCMRV